MSGSGMSSPSVAAIVLFTVLKSSGKSFLKFMFRAVEVPVVLDY
jgi:hypothetical protein